MKTLCFPAMFSVLFRGISYLSFFNPFPNGKILGLSKFKAFADDRIDVSKQLIFGLGRVENIVGNGENAGYWHFGENAGYWHFLLSQCFQKASSSRSLKVVIVW